MSHPLGGPTATLRQFYGKFRTSDLVDILAGFEKMFDRASTTEAQYLPKPDYLSNRIAICVTLLAEREEQATKKPRYERDFRSRSQIQGN